jgi:putative tricarboxylic transport membrane protein
MTLITNRITGSVGLLYALFYFVFAYAIPAPPGLAQDLLGSRAFPMAIGVLMGVCAIGIFFIRSEETADEEIVGWEGIVRLLPYVFILALYILLLPYLGLIIDTTLALFAVMNRMSRKIWWKDLLLSAIISASLWVLFVVILKVSLPSGLLGFLG